MTTRTSKASAAESMKLISDRSTRTVSAPTVPASSIRALRHPAVYESSSPDTETSASSRVRMATAARNSSRYTSRAYGAIRKLCIRVLWAFAYTGWSL